MSCIPLTGGLDFACVTSIARKYYQEMVVINSDDLDASTVVKTINNVGTCEHNVAFTLKSGTTGYKLSLPEAGGSIFGSFDKTRNTFGLAQYSHKINYAVFGITENVKCFLRTLDKGSYIIALRAKGSTDVEIYGLENGVYNGDYTFDIASGEGGSAIVLQSLETAPESQIPFLFKSADPVADFDSAFAN